MLEQLRERWRAHHAVTPIHDAMAFGPDGLVLGAGTVLAGGDHWEAESDGEARLLTLLSVAYARPVRSETLRHIRRAALRRCEGEADLAAMHLALTGLGKLHAPPDAARRLFMADVFLRAGIPAAEILAAAGVDAVEIDPGFAKNEAYQTEDRAPPGLGRESGRWIDRLRAALRQAGAAVAGDGAKAGHALATGMAGAMRAGTSAARPVAGLLEHVSPAQVGRLLLGGAAEVGEMVTAAGVGATAVAAGGVAGVAGILAIPSNRMGRAEGDIPGRPGWRYQWSEDAQLQIAHEGPHGISQQVIATPGRDGRFRTPDGAVVAMLLPGGHSVAVDAGAVSAELVRRDEPNFCPAPTPDRPGARAKDRIYEDRVAHFVNPTAPTPRGLAVKLLNLITGKPVVFDDCERKTGNLIEAKGTGYARQLRLQLKYPKWGVAKGLLNQALRQVQASNGRPVEWFFAEPEAAEEARRLFIERDEGRENIRVFCLPLEGEEEAVAFKQALAKRIAQKARRGLVAEASHSSNREQDVKTVNYSIMLQWNDRPEPPHLLAEKFRRTLEDLSRADPTFRNWGVSAASDDNVWGRRISLEEAIELDLDEEQLAEAFGKFVPFTPTLDIADIVERNVSLDDEGEPEPYSGYSITACNDKTGEPDETGSSMVFRFTVGAQGGNRIDFHVGAQAGASDLSVVDFTLFKTVLSTLVSVWAPTAGDARIFFSDYDDPGTVAGVAAFPYSNFHIPWISYLSAPLADGLDAPAGTQAEQTPDGGRLIVTTEDRLDPDNPEHMQRACAVAELLIDRVAQVD